MDQHWVKVFLKNGQFETASGRKRPKEQDHVYEYLVSKYIDIFNIPDTPKPKAKRTRSISAIKSKASTIRNQSFSFERKTAPKRNSSCPRCVEKHVCHSTQLRHPSPLKPKKCQSTTLIPRRKIHKLLNVPDTTSIEVQNNYCTKTVNLSTHSKRIGFIRRPTITPIDALLSSERALRS